jgi:hypothetical protein
LYDPAVPAAASSARSRAHASVRRLLIGMALADGALAWTACAVKAGDVIDGVLRPCREQRRVENYLLPDAQQCWYASPNGRWRILNHELHYNVLVVETEATRFADAEAITRRFVDAHGGASEDFTSYSEILVYLQEESAPATSTIHRVRWSTSSGTYDVLEFEGSLQRR